MYGYLLDSICIASLCCMRSLFFIVVVVALQRGDWNWTCCACARPLFLSLAHTAAYRLLLHIRNEQASHVCTSHVYYVSLFTFASDSYIRRGKDVLVTVFFFFAYRQAFSSFRPFLSKSMPHFFFSLSLSAFKLGCNFCKLLLSKVQKGVSALPFSLSCAMHFFSLSLLA